MPSVQYTIQVVTKSSRTSLTTDETGQNAVGSILADSNGMYGYDIPSYTDLIDNGWVKTPVIDDLGNRISLYGGLAKYNGNLLYPHLNGPVLHASQQVKLADPNFLTYISTETCLAVETNTSSIDPLAVIFKRSGELLSIHKDYKFRSWDLIHTTLGQDEFTRINMIEQEEGKPEGAIEYFVFNRQNPIALTELKGGILDLPASEYFKAAVDYPEFCVDNGITEADFLSHCEYHTAEELGIHSADFLETSGILGAKTEFFPIYGHVTVVVRRADDTLEQTTVLTPDVNVLDGIINIPTQALETPVGEISGVYVYYGVIPAVYINRTPIVMHDYDILSEFSNTSTLGINSFDSSKDIYYSDPVVNLSAGDTSGANRHTTYVEASNYYTNIFFEPESDIVINGELVSAGTKFVVDNVDGNFIEFMSPPQIVNLVEKAIMADKSLVPQFNLLHGHVSAFGMFDYVAAKRLSWMSSTSLPDNPESAQGAQISQGGFGAGTFSGTLTGGNQAMLFTIEAETGLPAYDYLLQETSYKITPSRDGFEYILPLWADPTSVRVTELDKNLTTDVPFFNWQLINPDVILLDRTKVMKSRTYNVAFTPVASFIMERNDLSLDDISVIIDDGTDLFATYNNLLDIYLLANKTFKVKVGYLDTLGNPTHFPKEITINQYIHEDLRDKIMSGYKSIIF